MTDESKGPGRPKVTEDERKQLRSEVQSQLWTPGSELKPVGASTNKLPDVYLPPPKHKKGTSEYQEWAKACFLELVRHGYNFSQAAEKVGYNYKSWSRWSTDDPEFAEEARAIRSGGVETQEHPDLTQMSFEEFVREYFGFELSDHQRQIAAALEDRLAKLVLLLAWPEAGKSTLVTLWYVIYRIAQNPDIRIALVSKSGHKAQDLLTRVKRYLTEEHLYEDTPRNLVADFHGFKPSHGELEWSQDQIFIRQRRSGERDPTVQALGIRKQIYGARLDLLILDDALILDNQVSENERNRIDQWFTNEARSRAMRGQTVVCGTRVFPHDLYGQWKKSWSGMRLFRGVFLPAILDEWTEDERPNWPEYWTLDGYDVTEEIDGEDVIVGFQPGLRDIRQEIMARDPARWKLVYQQEDVEEVDNIFRQAHIDLALDLGANRPMGKVFPHEILILGVDPATTGRAAAVLLAVDPISRVRTVVDIFVGAGLGATGIRNDLIYRFWNRFNKDKKVDFTVVETNFVPTLLSDQTLMERANSYGTNLTPHKTLGKGRKRGSIHDEEYGIAAMSALFSGGLLAFANGGTGDLKKLQPLIDDMLSFPWSDTKDALVALWVANGEASIPHPERVDAGVQAMRRGAPPIVAGRTRRQSGIVTR